MTSGDPGPGQTYAIEARKHITALRAREPGIRIEIRWCPSHHGNERNEWADEWAEQAADEPDAHGSTTRTRTASSEKRLFPLPRSLANFKRDFSEKKWTEARDWVSRKLAKTSNRKYRPSEKQKPDVIVAGTNKRLASRFYQLKTGHCLTGQYIQWTSRRPDTKCWWCQYSVQARGHLFKNRPQWRCQQKPSGQPS